MKAANVLLDEHMHAKIADFGVSAVIGDIQHRARLGSPYWMAPEVFETH